MSYEDDEDEMEANNLILLLAICCDDPFEISINQLNELNGILSTRIIDCEVYISSPQEGGPSLKEIEELQSSYSSQLSKVVAEISRRKSLQ